ncbi:MAG TPA: hypothetical protein VFQ53_04650 [Kofleriaceae bacterium]|nr:hypothetical protein [Kofleriaceae bacterium]
MRPEDPKRAAFDAQATPRVLDKMYRAAKARMHVYAGRTQHVNAADVDDMVMGIIADTLDGSLRWNFERKPLELHLLDTVRFRVRDEARKRWRDTARGEVLDEETTDASVGESMLAGALPERPDELHQIRRIADKLVADLRQRIAGDRDVEQLFDAIVVKRAHERAEIMEETGMSAAAYRNARRRLDRTLLQLPPETRDAVMTAFTN